MWTALGEEGLLLAGEGDRGSEAMGNGLVYSLVDGDEVVLWCCLWSVDGERLGLSAVGRSCRCWRSIAGEKAGSVERGEGRTTKREQSERAAVVKVGKISGGLKGK